MPLPTNWTTGNTDAEHVGQHNDLSTGHNANETHRGQSTDAHGGIVAGTDARLSDARPPTAHEHAYSALSDVNLDGLADQDSIKWDAASGKWVRVPSGTYGLASDPQGIGVPYSFNPLLGNANNAADANSAHFFRSQGGGTITKIAIVVGTSSGNVCVAVARGTGGQNAPTTRVATSGSVPCPASGYAEIALTSLVAVSAVTDYLVLAPDNATATFLRAGAGSTFAWSAGLSYWQASAFPVPAAVAPTPAAGAARAYILVGRP